MASSGVAVRGSGMRAVEVSGGGFERVWGVAVAARRGSGAVRCGVVAGLRRVKERIEAAQAELDELEVPESWVEFVEADDGRRQERLRLVDELANALEQEDSVQADTVDRDLTALNVETEAAENSNGLRHCP